MFTFIGRLIDDKLLKEQVKLIVQNSIAIDKLSSYIPEDDLEFLRPQIETAMETVISGDEISQKLRDRFAALNIKLRTTHTNSLMKSMGTFSSLYQPEAGWDIFLRATLPKIKAARLAKKDICRTYYNTFKKLLKASKDPELLTRSLEMSTALVACGAALRDVYGLPFEEDGTAWHYMVAQEKADYTLIEGLDGSLMEGLKMSADWPEERKRRWIALHLHTKHVKKWEEKWQKNYQ